MDRAAEYRELKAAAKIRNSHWQEANIKIHALMSKQLDRRESADHWMQQAEMIAASFILDATGSNAEQRKADVPRLQKKASATSTKPSLPPTSQDNRNEYETTGIELDAARNAASVHKTMLNVLDGQMRVLASL